MWEHGTRNGGQARQAIGTILMELSNRNVAG